MNFVQVKARLILFDKQNNTILSSFTVAKLFGQNSDKEPNHTTCKQIWVNCLHAFDVFLRFAEPDHLLPLSMVPWGLVPFDFARVHGKMQCNKLTLKCKKSPDVSRCPALYHADNEKFLNISSTTGNIEKKKEKKEKKKKKNKMQHMCNLFQN